MHWRRLLHGRRSRRSYTDEAKPARIAVAQCNTNVDEQRHAGKAGEQTSQEERPADDFGDADKWRHELRQRNADLRKTANSRLFDAYTLYRVGGLHGA